MHDKLNLNLKSKTYNSYLTHIVIILQAILYKCVQEVVRRCQFKN